MQKYTKAIATELQISVEDTLARKNSNKFDFSFTYSYLCKYETRRSGKVPTGAWYKTYCGTHTGVESCGSDQKHVYPEKRGGLATGNGQEQYLPHPATVLGTTPTARNK